MPVGAEIDAANDGQGMDGLLPEATAQDGLEGSSSTSSDSSDDSDDDDEQPAASPVQEAPDGPQFVEVSPRISKAKAKAKAKAAIAEAKAQAKAKTKATAAAMKQQKAELKESAQNLSSTKGKYKKLKEQFRKWRHSHPAEALTNEYSNTPGILHKVNEARHATCP